jgi:S-adenosylmethionine:tRNA ribosyltransferase-isomerase
LSLMDLSLFDYPLPEHLVASHPADQRDQARLMIIDRSSQSISHHHFFELPTLLRPGDVLVLNNSLVIPARLIGHRLPSGGTVEVLLLREEAPMHWTALVKPGKKIQEGTRIVFQKDLLEAEVLEYRGKGERLVQFHCSGEWWETLDKLGHTPLPPYILKARKRLAQSRHQVALEEKDDRERYQTVYATARGSVAAPTAGLHFTKPLLEKIENSGISLAWITLHIGAGTFKPVTTQRVEDHPMHAEYFSLDQETADLLTRAKQARQRIVAVGTTVVRTLETLARSDGSIASAAGATTLMILPGHQFKMVDAILTNFHLPRTTLFMLVAAFAGLDFIKNAYQCAIQQEYRFYSYGDAMLII